jgi:hypothetical protein
MGDFMIRDLIKIANKLDRVGLNKEADILDKIILKISSMTKEVTYIVRSGDTFSEIVEMVGLGSGKTYEENVNLNKSKDPSFNPSKIFPGQKVFIYAPQEAEDVNKPILPPYRG